MTYTVADYWRTAASVAALLACVIAPAAFARADQSPLALACNRNPSLTAYTFDMNVVLAMHHFPWLHFRLAGEGQTVRGEHYMVHFTKMPFFVRGMNEVDLSTLDPRMWEKRYILDLVDQKNSMTTFSLRPRDPDQEQTNPLTNALVTLDANYATRTVVLQYANGGNITLNLTPENTYGYWLPVAGEAQIDMPGEVLSAHASFSNYAIESTEASNRARQIDGFREKRVNGEPLEMVDSFIGVERGVPRTACWRGDAKART